MKHKRNWNRIKGFRKKQPAMPVFVVGTNICQVVHNRIKFEFWTDQPLEKPLEWGDVHGCRIDTRVIPALPQGFEKMRPLRKPDRNTPIVAKKTAYGVILENRRKALERLEHPSLFSDLPVQLKPPRNVA